MLLHNVIILSSLFVSSTYGWTKDEVKKMIPDACYEQWMGDGECDTQCAFDTDCDARFQESGIKVSDKTTGETRGFEILDASKEEQKTNSYYVAYVVFELEVTRKSTLEYKLD